MKRALITIGTALALALAAVVAPAGPASAACVTSKPRGVTGGYAVSIVCGGPVGIVTGYGSTGTDANVEAVLLVKLFQDGGPHCSGLGVDRKGSLYRVTLDCGVGNLGFVYGQGDTLTAAAQIARLTAEVIGSGR